MYYNKRDLKGRFTKTCKKGSCTCKKKLEAAKAVYTSKLLNDCAVFCKNASTDQLEQMFKDVAKDMANVKLPEENLEDLAPFLIAMHTFYELALKGTLFAQELDRRKADAEIKEKLSNKRVEKKSFEDNAFKSVKEVAAMLGLPEDAIQDFLFLDLNTGECCEAHRKYKK